MHSESPLWLRILLALLAVGGIAGAVAAYGLGSMVILVMMADAGMKHPDLAENAMLGYWLSLALAGACGFPLGLGLFLPRHRKKLLVATLVQAVLAIILAVTAIFVYFKAVTG